MLAAAAAGASTRVEPDCGVVLLFGWNASEGPFCGCEGTLALYCSLSRIIQGAHRVCKDVVESVVFGRSLSKQEGRQPARRGCSALRSRVVRSSSRFALSFRHRRALRVRRQREASSSNEAVQLTSESALFLLIGTLSCPARSSGGYKQGLLTTMRTTAGLARIAGVCMAVSGSHSTPSCPRTALASSARG